MKHNSSTCTSYKKCGKMNVLAKYFLFQFSLSPWNFIYLERVKTATCPHSSSSEMVEDSDTASDATVKSHRNAPGFKVNRCVHVKYENPNAEMLGVPRDYIPLGYFMPDAICSHWNAGTIHLQRRFRKIEGFKSVFAA